MSLYDIAIAKKLISGGSGGGGSSDFSTAEVTINATIEGSPTLVYKGFGTQMQYPVGVNNPYRADLDDFSENILLYQNEAIIGLDTIYCEDSDGHGYMVSTNPTPTTSENATYDDENGVFIITGDCTINVKMTAYN